MPLKVQGSVLAKTTAGSLLSFRKSVISVPGFLVTFGIFSSPCPHLAVHRMTNYSELWDLCHLSCGGQTHVAVLRSLGHRPEENWDPHGC